MYLSHEILKVSGWKHPKNIRIDYENVSLLQTMDWLPPEMVPISYRPGHHLLTRKVQRFSALGRTFKKAVHMTFANRMRRYLQGALIAFGSSLLEVCFVRFSVQLVHVSFHPKQRWFIVLNHNIYRIKVFDVLLCLMLNKKITGV